MQNEHPTGRRESLDVVREFHETFKQIVSDVPHLHDDELNALRVGLLREETKELEDALALRDPVAALDALADLQYVLDGAYLSLGFHRVKHAAVLEAHRSNLTKLDENGHPIYHPNGKVKKGPNFQEPDFASVLRDILD